MVSGGEAGRIDDARVQTVALNPNGTRIAVGIHGSALVLETVSGAEIWHVNHGDTVSAVAFSPDGTQVATGSDDRSVRVLDALTGTEVWRVDHNGRVNAVAFS